MRLGERKGASPAVVLLLFVVYVVVMSIFVVVAVAVVFVVVVGLDRSFVEEPFLPDDGVDDNDDEYPSYCHNRSKACLEGSARSAIPLMDTKTEWGGIPAHQASDPGVTFLTYNPRANRDKESPTKEESSDGVEAVGLAVVVVEARAGIVTEYVVYSPSRASPCPCRGC